MSVQKRGSGRDARWVVRWRVNGAQKSRSFRTHLEASRYDRQVHHELVTGRYVDPNAGDILFRAYAESWLQGKHDIRDSTRRLYRLALENRVYPLIGEMPLNRFAPSDIRALIATLVSEVSVSRVQTVAQIVKQIFAQATGDQLIQRNPALKVTVPKASSLEVTVVSPDEVKRLDEAAGRHGLLVTFLAYTGLRWGEATALAIADVDLLRGEVRVSKSYNCSNGTVGPTKTGKPRTVPLEPRLLARIRDHVAGRRASEPLFTGDKGGRVNGAWFHRRVWGPAKQQAKVDPTLVVHALRHTCATWLVQTTDLRTAAEFLGHTDLATTARYLHTAPDRLQAAAQALSAGVDTSPSTGLVVGLHGQ